MWSTSSKRLFACKGLPLASFIPATVTLPVRTKQPIDGLRCEAADKLLV